MLFTIQCYSDFALKVLVEGILTQFKRQKTQILDDLVVANVIASMMRNGAIYCNLFIYLLKQYFSF